MLALVFHTRLLVVALQGGRANNSEDKAYRKLCIMEGSHSTDAPEVVIVMNRSDLELYLEALPCYFVYFWFSLLVYFIISAVVFR